MGAGRHLRPSYFDLWAEQRGRRFPDNKPDKGGSLSSVFLFFAMIQILLGRTKMGRNNHAGRFLVGLSSMVTLMMAVFLGNNMMLRPDEKPIPKGSINVIGVWKRIKSDVDGSRVFSKEGEMSVRYDDEVHEGTFRMTGNEKMETGQKCFGKMTLFTHGRLPSIKAS